MELLNNPIIAAIVVLFSFVSVHVIVLLDVYLPGQFSILKLSNNSKSVSNSRASLAIQPSFEMTYKPPIPSQLTTFHCQQSNEHGQKPNVRLDVWPTFEPALLLEMFFKFSHLGETKGNYLVQLLLKAADMNEQCIQTRIVNEFYQLFVQSQYIGSILLNGLVSRRYSTTAGKSPHNVSRTMFPCLLLPSLPVLGETSRPLVNNSIVVYQPVPHISTDTFAPAAEYQKYLSPRIRFQTFTASFVFK